jgi:hypothetical protein
MIGEREIMIDVLLLPEMSRAERAGASEKNEQFPMYCGYYCPQAAPPRRGVAIGRSDWKLVYCAFPLISSASRDAAQRACEALLLRPMFSKRMSSSDIMEVRGQDFRRLSISSPGSRAWPPELTDRQVRVTGMVPG